jgi:hypothetical protein
MAIESTEVAVQPGRTGRLRRAATVGIPLALATCAGLILRSIRAAGSGLFRDEALCLFVADSPTVADLFGFLRFHESHPPLFYLMLRLWRAAFGPSAAAAQALSVLLGTALVPVAYLVGARMFSRRAGLIAAALVAAWPSLVYYSAVVRPYSLLPLLGLVSSYCLWSGLRGGGRPAWAGYVVTTLAMLYTHNWAWVFLAAHWAAALAWLAWFRGPWEAARGWALAQAGLAAGYAPWLPALLYQVRHAGNDPPRLPSLYWIITDAVTVLHAALSPFARQSLWALVAAGLAAAAAWLYRRRDRRPDLPQGWWAGVLLMATIPLLVWVIALALNPRGQMLILRCFVTVVPCMLVAVAQVIAALSPPGRPALPAALALLLVMVDVRAVMKRAEHVRSNAREMAAAVAAQARPSDLVVIAPDWLASSFNFYFRLENPQIVYSYGRRMEAIMYDDPFERCADPQVWERVKARLLQSRLQGERVWLVMDRENISDDIPDEDNPSAPTVVKGYGQLAIRRANQVRRYLIDLYGPADITAVPPDTRTFGEDFGFEYESMAVLLFAPPGPGTPRGVGGPK